MTKKYSDERRAFLKTVALLGGAAACIPMAKDAAAGENQAPPAPEPSSQGYRQTEHISKYYQTARN